MRDMAYDPHTESWSRRVEHGDGTTLVRVSGEAYEDHGAEWCERRIYEALLRAPKAVTELLVTSSGRVVERY